MKKFLFSREINLLERLLSHVDFPLIELIRLGIALLEACAQWRNRPTSLQAARKAIELGAKALYENEKSISFERAVQETLAAKSHRRQQTLSEIRYITRKLMSRIPGLAKRSVRSLTTQEWAQYLESVFVTPRQRRKARTIVHGVFALMVKRNWCSENPISKVDIPSLQENIVPVLSPQEAEILVQTATEKYDGECLPAVAIMLYAGVRPQEVQGLTWRQINLQEGIISLLPYHVKTGGTRHITIEPILSHILKMYEREYQPLATQFICPKYWNRKWREIRCVAGWTPHDNPWRQDCLRHSYATYHALYYKDFIRLQYEMGHASVILLKTRYLNLGNLYFRDAECFWNGGKILRK